MKRACVLVACLVAVSLAASASARTLHYQLTVVVTGSGHVTGTGDGGSISCPDQCSALIRQNTSITLTATPDGGATFAGWAGDCAPAGTATTCTVTMTGQGANGAKSVTAGFGTPPPPPRQFMLGVKKIGTAPGYVGGGGLDCGKVCSKSLVQGTRVTLVAVPTGRAVFLGWSGPCSGAGPCGVTVKTDTAVTATFADPRRPFVLTMGGAVARGKATLLRFHAWVSKGRSREELTVAKGKTLLARAMVAMKRVTYQQVYSVRWLVPQKIAAVTARFCAVAIDQAGRHSPKACSSLKIV